MILPVNVNPSIISYAHHAYPMAIMERGKQHCLAVIRLNIESDLFEEVLENDTEITKRSSTLEIRNKKYAQNTECFVLKECQTEEDVVLEMLECKADALGGILNLIISGEQYLEAAHTNRDIYRMGIICGGGLLCSENGDYKAIPMSWLEKNNCNTIRLSRKKDEITYWAMGEKDWIEVYRTRLPEHLADAKLYIGINGNWGELQFYNWKYMNYLQLAYTEKDHFVWLDYFLYPRKNYSFNHAQQFLDITDMSLFEVYEIHGSIADGVLWYLKHGYYVEITMDEYYIPERAATGKNHFYHNNLLYGFSVDESEFYGLGYKDKLQVAAIKKDVVNKYIKEGSQVKIYKYNPNNLAIPFNMKKFIELLKEFVQGESTGFGFCNILPEDDYTYGLRVFEVMLKEQRARYVIQHDQRVVYVIYEHARIMAERLEFFRYRGYFSEEEYEWLQSMCAEMVRSIENMKNLVLKNKIKGNYDDLILVRLEQVYQREKEFYTGLLKVLTDRYGD